MYVAVRHTSIAQKEITLQYMCTHHKHTQPLNFPNWLSRCFWRPTRVIAYARSTARDISISSRRTVEPSNRRAAAKSITEANKRWARRNLWIDIGIGIGGKTYKWETNKQKT